LSPRLGAMITVGVSVRGAVAGLISGVSLVFGFAGTAHAHGTHVAPIEPQLPLARAHHGPFSVLHQAGPFSVLRPLAP
jgi:hypothetical protein